MKNVILLLLTTLCALTSCDKQVEPTPQLEIPTPPSDEVSYSTYLEFRVFDAADGDQFNTTLSGRVFYFSPSATEADINAYFGNPDTNDNWNDAPRAADDEYDIENSVGPYDYSADPGFFHLNFPAQRRIAIVWTFVDADPRARRGYRQQLFIWDGAGENYRLSTDRFRAGL